MTLVQSILVRLGMTDGSGACRDLFCTHERANERKHAQVQAASRR
jgi:hypothetical protein